MHRGCELEIQYVMTNPGHEVTSMRFDDGVTTGNDIYKVNSIRAQMSWDKYKDYYNSFDGIITSDTCPISRPFLQNSWDKPLIIWVCNRFDYAVWNDNSFYDLIRGIPNKPNITIIGNTPIENIYSSVFRQTPIGEFVIKPTGKNILSSSMTKTYENNSECFYIPPYHNETILMNLSEKLTSIGIENKCERFPNHISDLLVYKGVICIPYAWSTIAFFERMQLGLITFVPSINFLFTLFKTGNKWFQEPFSWVSESQARGLLKVSEWYCDEHTDLLVYFDSWEDLVQKTKELDYVEKTKTILDYAKKHENDQMEKWKQVLSKPLLLKSICK